MLIDCQDAYKGHHASLTQNELFDGSHKLEQVDQAVSIDIGLSQKLTVSLPRVLFAG